MLPSPDFRLPQNVTSCMVSPDQFNTRPVHSSGLAESSKKVSTRIPQMSTLGTLSKGHATCHYERLDIDFLVLISSFDKT